MSKTGEKKVTCICGKPFLTKGTRKYCKECVALARKRKRPIIMLKGGKIDE